MHVLPVRPVSELLEFRGEGPVSKPHWRPRYLSIGSGRNGDERKPSKELEAEAARQAEGVKPGEPVPERRR